jgi:hypothetical protein
MKILFDDIIIWSNNDIKSIRFESFLSKNYNNITKIFKLIFDFINVMDYTGNVLIVNSNMYINVNFNKILNDNDLLKKYNILQLGIDSNEKLNNFDKIYSLGAFIINLKNLNSIKSDINISNYNFKNILATKELYFMHPIRYKKYKLIKNINKINSFFKFKNIFFKKKYLRKINGIIDPFKKCKHNFFFNIKQVYVSESLHIFKDRIKKVFNLKDYYDNSSPCLFFGLYNSDDIYKLSGHKGNRYVIWGGSDADKNQPNHNLLLKVISEINIDRHYAISIDIKNRLTELGFKSKLINFNLVDTELFKPVEKIGNKIYIYNGNKKGRENIYGKDIYKEVVKILPEFEFIYSNELNKKYEEMPEVYQQCFIGLRLTNKDGNANTVQEMGAMNIPVIHNGYEKNALSWRNIDDVELRIRYRNIDIFNDSIKDKKKIIFFCTDFPGYGGAATNSLKLIEFYRKLGKEVIGIFYTKNKAEFKYSKYINVIDRLDKIVNFIKFNPDLIILRNFIEINILKLFNCPSYFLIPGIFEPHLDKKYNLIKTKKEMNKYIHKKILNTIRWSTKSFCASNHTRKILSEYYNLKVEILFFNYITFYNKFINEFNNFDKRKYEYGVIVSNFERKVKNLDLIVNKLRKNKLKKILIGKNSNKYGGSKIRNIELIKNEKVFDYYKQIKYIVQDSYYESCSNVAVESRFFGCKLIGLDDIFVDSKILEINNVDNIKLINSISKYNIKVMSDKSYHNILKLNDSDSINQINKDFSNLLQKRDLMISIKKRKYKSIFKVLYFINIDYFIRKMSRVRFHSIIKLLEYDNIILYFTGPGWYNYNDSISMENNINNMKIKFDFVIFYKPLDEFNNINKKTFKKINFLKCIRYNEMWDEKWTKKEINQCNSNLIICHHYNDYLKYKDLYKNDIKRRFIYNPHHANPEIFYDFGKEREYDILLAGKSTIKHYPLRYRLFNLIQKNKNTELRKYKIFEQNHPGYNNDFSYKDLALIDYSKNINKCYLCIGGTSKYNYRLGKYVEISMCGSLILGDIPYEDKDNFKKFVIDVNMNMTDNEILNVIKKTLDDKNEMKRKMLLAKQWAQKYTTEKYCKILVDSMKKYKIYNDNNLKL